MEQYVAAVRGGRTVIERFFHKCGFSVHGTQSNTILVGLPGEMPAPATAAMLAERGWLVRAETKPPARNHLRITIGPAEQMERFCEAFSVASR